jgi:hypothetical protein
MITVMASAILITRPEPAVTRILLAQREAHRRQRDLVRASLVCRPLAGRPTHRRWA